MTPKRMHNQIIFHERIVDGAVPSPAELDRGLGGEKNDTFVHRLSHDGPLRFDSRVRCGEVPAGGFYLVPEEQYQRHPCPDCARREREKKS